MRRALLALTLLLVVGTDARALTDAVWNQKQHAANFPLDQLPAPSAAASPSTAPVRPIDLNPAGAPCILSAPGSNGLPVCATPLASLSVTDPISSTGGASPTLGLKFTNVDLILTGPGALEVAAFTGAVTKAAGATSTIFGSAGAHTVLGVVGGSTAIPAYIGPAAPGQFFAADPGTGDLGWTSTIPATSAPLAAGAVGFGSASNLLTGDAANFHWDGTNFRLGLREVAPAWQLHLVDESGASDRGAMLGSYAATTTGMAYRFQKSRGTYASPVVVNSGDYLGRIEWQGYGASAAYVSSSAIGVQALGAPSGVHVPVRMFLAANRDGVSSDPFGNNEVGLTLAAGTTLPPTVSIPSLDLGLGSTGIVISPNGSALKTLPNFLFQTSNTMIVGPATGTAGAETNSGGLFLTTSASGAATSANLFLTDNDTCHDAEPGIFWQGPVSNLQTFGYMLYSTACYSGTDVAPNTLVIGNVHSRSGSPTGNPIVFQGYNGSHVLFNEMILPGDGSTLWTDSAAAISPAGTSGIRSASGQLQYSQNHGAWKTFDSLAGVADPGSNGIMVRTALNTTTARTIVAGDGTIIVTNGSGISGNPSIVVGTVPTSQLSGTIALGTLVPPTGTGFFHVTGGAADPAARAVNLATADVTGLLALANFTPGSNGQVLTTSGGVPTWSAGAVGGITQLTGDGVAGPGSGSQNFILANIGNGVTAAGDINFTLISAPGAPASGHGLAYADLGSGNWAFKNSSNVVNHGIQTNSGTAHDWVSAIAADGSVTLSRPDYTDLTGTPTIYNQTIQANGTPQTQEPVFNFDANFSLSVGGGKNTISLGGPLSPSNTFGSAGQFIQAFTTDASGRVSGATPTNFPASTELLIAASGAAPVGDATLTFNTSTHVLAAGTGVGINGVSVSNNTYLVGGHSTNADQDRVQFNVGGGTLGPTGTGDGSFVEIIPTSTAIRGGVTGGIYSTVRIRAATYTGSGQTINDACTLCIDDAPTLTTVSGNHHAIRVFNGSTELDGPFVMPALGFGGTSIATFDAGGTMGADLVGNGFTIGSGVISVTPAANLYYAEAVGWAGSAGGALPFNSDNTGNIPSSIPEVPIGFLAGNATLTCNLQSNLIAAGGSIVFTLERSGIIVGTFFTLTSASSTGSYTATMATGSGASTDTYAVHYQTGGVATSPTRFGCQLAFAP